MGPCLAVSGDSIHVVWSDSSGRGTAIYYTHSLDTGTTWSSPVTITPANGSATFPCIAVSGAMIHVAWFDNRLGHPASFYKRSTDGGNTWGPDICLDSNTTFWPGIAASGSLVALSINKAVADTNTEVFFIRSTNNGTTWDAEQRISNAPYRSEDPAIAIQGSYIHCSWNDNRNGGTNNNMEIYYRRSTDAGVTWGPETQLIHGSTGKSYTSMVCLNGSSVNVPCGDTRTGNFHVFLKQSSDFGATWGNDMQLTNDSYTEAYPFMIRDSLNVHMACVQFNNGALYIHSIDGGATWSQPILLSSGGQPFIAYTGSVLHAIFPDSGNIYYRRNRTGNAHIVTSVAEKAPHSSALALFVYPDVFQQTTTIQYTLAESGNATVKIYDMLGREITTLADGEQKAGGLKQLTFEATGLAPGMYLCRLSAGNSSVTKKLILVK